MTTRRPHHLSLAQITTRIGADSAKLLGVIAAREKRSVSAQLAVIVELFLAAERKKTQKTTAPVAE